MAPRTSLRARSDGYAYYVRDGPYDDGQCRPWHSVMASVCSCDGDGREELRSLAGQLVGQRVFRSQEDDLIIEISPQRSSTADGERTHRGPFAYLALNLMTQ